MVKSTLRRLGRPDGIFDPTMAVVIRFGSIVGAVAAILQILQMVNQPLTILQFRIGGILHSGLVLVLSALLAVAWPLLTRLRTDTLQNDHSTKTEASAEGTQGDHLPAGRSSDLPIRQTVYLRDVVFRPTLSSVSRLAWTEAGWIALILIISFYTFSQSFSEYRKEQALLNAFEVTSGTILLKEDSQDQGIINDLHITYSFQVSAAASTGEISYTNRVSVPEIVFSSVSEFDSIPVRFASEQPEWSEIEGQHVSSMPSALVYLGIAIFALGHAAKRTRQLWLEYIFQQGTEDCQGLVNGEVITGWTTSSQYHIAFRYIVNNEEYRVGQAVALGDFFALRIGDPLHIHFLVQRPSICKAVRYRTSEGPWASFQML
jgi:hypothetical protein